MPSQLNTDHQHGVATVLERLLREHRKALVGLAASRLTDRSEAEDVVQSAAASFLLSFDPAANPHGEVGAYRYLKAAVCSHAWKHNRTRRRRRQDSSVLDTVCDVVVEAAGESIPERLAALELERGALAELAPDERRAVAMRAAGFPTSEILTALNCSPRKLRKTIERANRKLRAAMESQGASD